VCAKALISWGNLAHTRRHGCYEDDDYAGMAATPMMPIFSWAQAMDRVRGICVLSLFYDRND
jgi:hypothetical protein